MNHRVQLRGNALGEIEARSVGVRQDPAIELLMRHVAAGDVDLAEVMREFMPVRRYGVTVTVEMMTQAIERIIKQNQRPVPPPKPRLPDVVYYMRIGNRVKIGTSTNLVERLKTFNPEELMVTEPGGAAVERARHKQFADLRVNGEWFRLEGPLVDHIEKLRASW